MSVSPTDFTAMSIVLYGIPNCDTVKKARTWLADAGIDFTFHDFKKQGLAPATVAAWLKELDWEVLVNRKGTTWRNLPEERRAQVTDAASAKALMLENPSVVKRPVLCGAGPAQVGFAPEKYQVTFKP
jgi:arsenate reductase